MFTRMRLENFKSWEDTGDINLRPITGFFGPNSSGKTSLFQALLLMKQTVESSDDEIVLHFGDEATLVDLGDFQSVIYEHDLERSLKFSLGWKSKDDFEIPDSYAGGRVAVGDEIEFEVALRGESINAGGSLTLEEGVYRIAGRRIGMRRLPDRMDYDLFVSGSGISFSRYAGDFNRYSHPTKFHDFPHWTDHYFPDEDFLFNLHFGLKLLFEDLYYLGPLRASAARTYGRSGVQPSDVGTSGDFTVDVILSTGERAERMQQVLESPPPAIDVHVAGWLKHLGLVHDFRLEALAEGKRLFEVKVRQSPNSPEVLLTDVGFGVSQVLPVLALSFYAPRQSTLILEQPDIHLHPSVQAGLADVFIDAWKKQDVQILFESHSEHLLRRLQRRIAEEEIPEDDVGLYFCSTDDTGASNLSELEVDEFGNIANWPKDFFGDQFGEIAAMSEAALKRQVASE